MSSGSSRLCIASIFLHQRDTARVLNCRVEMQNSPRQGITVSLHFYDTFLYSDRDRVARVHLQILKIGFAPVMFGSLVMFSHAQKHDKRTPAVF